MLDWITIFLIFSAALAFLIFLWVYSGACLPFRPGNASELQELLRWSKLKSPYLMKSAVHLPWETMHGLMNLRTVSTESWIEQDEDVFPTLELLRNMNFNEAKIFSIASGYEDVVYTASIELLHLIIQFINNESSEVVVSCVDNEKMNIQTITNLVTNQSWSFSRAPLTNESCYDHPLVIARNLVADDLVIMVRKNISNEDDCRGKII